MKWALIGLLTLGALGAWAMSVQSVGTLSGEVKPMPLPKVAMRALPPLQQGPAIALKAKEPAKAEPAKAEPVKAEPVKAEPAKAPEPVAAAPAKEPEKAPEPAAVAKPEPKPEPVKVAAAPVQPKPKPQPAVVDDAPPPLPPPPAEKPKPAPALKPAPDDSAPAPAAAGGEGSINLKASDTAEIVVDGRKVGPSPKLGYKLKAGKHKIRFDCYDENGNLKPGKVQTVEIRPDEESDIEYECPFAQ